MALKPENHSSEIRKDEMANRNIWLERGSFRIVLISTFTALSVVSGYMLAFLPNIEIFTMMIFLSGFILGKRDGLIIGAMSTIIFCFFNPLGASPLPLLAVQLTYYSLVGFLGAMTRGFLKNKEFFQPEEDLYVFLVMGIFGVMGFLMTFMFHLFQAIVDTIIIFGTLDAFWIYIATDVLFTGIHLIGNTLVFIFLLPILIQILYKMLDIPNDY